MANASVEKLKALGLRHGEKAVVGLAVAACVVCLALATTRESIEMSPAEIEQHARSADSNLNQEQSTEGILQRLVDAGIKDPNFAKMVDDQEKNALVASAFTPPHPFVYPEPGAGLIRDTPELIAPTELHAYPGRGGALVFELDAEGNRIIDTSKTEQPAEPPSLAKGRRRARASRELAEKQEEAQRRYEREVARKKALLAGKGQLKTELAQAQPAVPMGPFKEITQGLRWVAITGVLDNKRLRENYLNALKRTEVAYPHFKQLEVERQARQPDGSWSDWRRVDLEQNRKILDNLPEVEEELTPETVRLEALVDPLPFLKAGYWERVHIARLVPREKIEVQKPQVLGATMPGSPYMGMETPYTPPPMGPPPGYMGVEMYGGGPMMSGMGGPTEDMSFPHSDADTLMIRSLDFTVEPDRTYRFRVRIVVYNPNRDREDVSPGVDTRSLELFGPWSEPTNEVTMPADTSAYVVNAAPPAGLRNDRVQFDVTRWNPQEGFTVEKTFDAGPGDIVGEYRRGVPTPSSEGKGQSTASIDFNSHQLLLDTTGGSFQAPPIPGATGRINVPAQALLIQPDGSVVFRNQADDVEDPVRQDIVANYKRELEESNKTRESSMGSSSMYGVPVP